MTRTKMLSSPRLVLGVFWVIAGLFHFVTMPRFTYPGDNMAIKAEAAHWVNTGNIGFDPAEAGMLEDLVTQEGQYFFANPASRRLFSKYGFFYSASYLLPFWLAKQITGGVEVLDDSVPVTFTLNCYHLIWALIYLIYLYRIFRSFCCRQGLALALVFLAVYPSFIWSYLRAPEKEILQMTAFAGAVFHMIRYLGSSRELRPSGGQLTMALCWAGYAYFLKPFNVLLLVAMATATVSDALRHGLTLGTGPGERAVSPWRKPLAALGLTLIGIAILSATHNVLRTGTMLDAGYGQDRTVPAEFIFTLDHFAKGLATYFVTPGNGNWFLHQPLLLLALFGFPAFFQRYRSESVFLLMGVSLPLVALCFHVEWVGEWCYGPRFCLPLIMMAVIPAAPALERLVSPGLWGGGRAVALALLVATTVVSLRGQFLINTWHYFTYYYYFVPFDTLKIELATRYFEQMPNRALLLRDLTRYRQEGRKFALLTDIDQAGLPPATVGFVYALTDRVIDQYRWNYLLLPQPNP